MIGCLPGSACPTARNDHTYAEWPGKKRFKKMRRHQHMLSIVEHEHVSINARTT